MLDTASAPSPQAKVLVVPIAKPTRASTRLNPKDILSVPDVPAVLAVPVVIKLARVVILVIAQATEGHTVLVVGRPHAKVLAFGPLQVKNRKPLATG